MWGICLNRYKDRYSPSIAEVFDNPILRAQRRWDLTPNPHFSRAHRAGGACLESARASLSETCPDFRLSKRRMRQAEAIKMVRCRRANFQQAPGFASRPFVLCGLPIKRPPWGELLHERRNGHFLVQVTGHPSYGLPWGQDRLVPIFLATLAVREQRQRITFRSGAEMLETFGLQQGGTRTQTAPAAKEQRLDEAFLDALADSSPVTPYILDCLASSPQSALAKNADLALIVHDSEHNSFDPRIAAVVPTREAGYAYHGTGESIRHPPTPAAVTRSEASINALRRPAIVRIRPVNKGQIKVYSPVRTAAHNSDPAHLQKGGIKPSIRKCVRPNQEFGVALRASCTVAKSLTNNHINLTHTCR